jgi:hypothetical protein
VDARINEAKGETGKSDRAKPCATRANRREEFGESLGMANMQQTAGNLAVQNLLCSGAIQAKQKGPGETEDPNEPDPNNPPAAAPSAKPAYGLIADDSTPDEDLQPGQMKRSLFLGQMRTAIDQTVEKALSGTAYSLLSGPVVDQQFSAYASKDNASLESAIRQQVPAAAGATTASAFIPAICAHVHAQIKGETERGLAGAVEEGAALLGDVAKSVGGTLAGVSSMFFKARDGGARKSDDLRSMRAQFGGGNALDGGTQSRMSSAFGHDFSDVRLHTDAGASQLADDLNARAFTVGKDIAFGAGEYQPGTLIGDALIAHELAHVLQQNHAPGLEQPLQKSETGDEALEAEADTSAVGAVLSLWSGTKTASSNISQNALPSLKAGLRLQRCEKTGPAPGRRGVVCDRPHPVNLHTIGKIAGGNNYGMTVIFTWKSSTESMKDLKGCQESEYISYSAIPNPPFGTPGGKPVAESGTTMRGVTHPAEGGKAQDTHRTPSEWISRPPRSEGSYTVTQTYDYKCPECGEWIVFADYVIKYELKKKGDEWTFITTKVGGGAQAGESFANEEAVT